MSESVLIVLKVEDLLVLLFEDPLSFTKLLALELDALVGSVHFLLKLLHLVIQCIDLTGE